jgi:hypothetical protein
MDRPITEAERLRVIVNDEARWSALSEKQQGELLADLYIAEKKDEEQGEQAKIQHQKMKAEQERREKELGDRERKIVEQKRAEAKKREEELALKKAREELEEAMSAQRFDAFFEKSIHEYRGGNPIIVEYFSPQTLQALFTYVQRFNNTDVAAPLAGKYNMPTSEVTEFVLKFIGAIQTELDKRKKATSTNFQTLIIKGLGRPPYVIPFETFEALNNKIKAIDILLSNPEESKLWAQDRQVSPAQIVESLKRIKTDLLQDKVTVTEKVFKDIKRFDDEKLEQEQARIHAIEVFKNAKKLQEYQAKRDQVKQAYPQFFHGIPYDMEIDFLNKFEELNGNNKNMNQVLTNLYYDVNKKPIAQMQRLNTLGALLGYVPYASYGYVFFDNKGQKSVNSGMVLPKVLSIQDRDPQLLNKKVIEATKELVKTYKIHLMPDESIDVAEILIRLDKALKADPELSSPIQTFKIHYNPTQQGGINFARVVIYANGKEHAQRILDALYRNNIIRSIKGSGIRPRFNGKVNELLWIAQGDGDYKDGIYREYYEPLLVYYNPGITGKRENYHLVNPETKQEIVG